MQDFKKLSVWEKSHKFTLSIYSFVNNINKREKFGLIPQLCRASVSIPTNIAEGCGKNTNKDFARFISIAQGSAKECEYLLILINDLRAYNSGNKERRKELVCENKELSNELIEIQKMLFSFSQKLKT
jgi:four helix bundle protein